MKTGRNAPCSCGSGRKFKRCCGGAARHNAVLREREARIAAARAETQSPADASDDLVEARARYRRTAAIAVAFAALAAPAR